MPKRKPHVCFVAPNAFPLLAGDGEKQIIGGAELQQVMVARGLVARGYQVSMICLDFGQRDRVQIDGITVFRAFHPEQGIPVVRFIYPRLVSLWRCLLSADADIYYQRTAGMLTGVVAAFCRYRNRKSVFAAAGNPDLELNTSRIRYGRDRRIYEYGVRNVDRILVQNREQARLCRTNFGRESTLVRNCYSEPVQQSQKPGRHVLWVSTIRRLKRPELFLDLAEALPDCQFRMIGGPGDGEKRLYESTRERAQGIPNVEFMGFVPFAAVEGHFDDAALFVNTSESEGFPNTFLQAWSRGKPTISFVDCGAREGGRPVGRQVSSLEEMQDVISSWCTDETERAREGSRCRQYYEKNHSPEHILGMYEEVFSELFTPSA